MYKFIVSCYYWPNAKFGLRLKDLTVADEPGRPEDEIVRPQAAERPRLYELTVERRQTPRRRVRFEAELKTGLSILDVDGPETTQSLIFFGETLDLSSGGIAVILPSTQIDERFCDGSQNLRISLYLPLATVAMDVNLVRCVPLNPANLNKGYLLGGKIVQIEANKLEFDRYLSKTLGMSPA